MKVKIWDSFVRGYHWLMVLAVAGLWWTGENGEMEWHLKIAIVLGSLLLARLVWALVGSENARFRAFVRGPREVLAHAKHMRAKNYTPGNTHNAMGGWAVLALWLVLAVQLTTGLFATDEIFFSGPLASLVSGDWQGTLTDIHEGNFNVLLALVGLHVFAIVVYRLRGINLLAAMLHGKRENVTAPRLRPSLIAWAVAALLAASGWYFWA
ncbi:cytochrome B [Pseudidiomarina sediminum]|uniref:Cytochrome B n=1 Tax=Pseudidiomarina sediminum TaxID=431675 RepID=A0A432Z3L8_9GAMM|nr:cytochrome b/b6 domain-containing protein [Pseudidiomarina sediminum]MBY6064743.1 cytochrome b/b6 domain-containing protein [Pseudidiomarina sediminum]RUO72433.1 cytochrome B [Pseudidiomarina sediminum]